MTDVELGAEHHSRNAVVISRVGLFCAVSTSVLYARLGSPWSGVAIGSIAVPLVLVPMAVRRGVPLAVVGHVTTSLAWLVTFVVGARTGGFSSPALVWSFFHPITMYVVCGRRSATVWASLSALQIVLFYVGDRAGFEVVQDLSQSASGLLRVAGFIGCIVANVALIAAIEGARAASQAAVNHANRTLERQRILGDMHDGIGSQLLGLMIQVRSGTASNDQILQGLGSSLDDLKLIVDSLDPLERSFDLALAELRARVEPRCAAADVALEWTVQPAPVAIDAERALQVLRAVQEMTTNALRHASCSQLVVTIGPLAGDESRRDLEVYEVQVRDDGVGFDPEHPSRVGRGLPSLHARAQRLGGELCITSAAPGTLVSLRFPVVP